MNFHEHSGGNRGVLENALSTCAAAFPLENSEPFHDLFADRTRRRD